MTRAVFYSRNGILTGFTVSGHTDAKGSAEAKLVCAAVSSAVYMAVNTLTDVIGSHADITEKDGMMSVSLTDACGRCQDVLAGLKLHLEGLSEQYSKYIAINTEVQHDA